MKYCWINIGKTGSHKKKFILDIEEEDADIVVVHQERPASIEDPKVRLFWVFSAFSDYAGLATDCVGFLFFFMKTRRFVFHNTSVEAVRFTIVLT